MKRKLEKSKIVIFAVIISSMIFIFIHSYEMSFQEYSLKLPLTLVRLAIFVPLLVFLYRGHNWARLLLGGINLILFVLGILVVLFLKNILTETNGIIFTVLMLCVTFNTYCLLFSKTIKSVYRSK